MLLLTFIFTATLIGCLVVRRRAALLGGAILGLFICCWPPTVWLFSSWLEGPYRATMPPPVKTDAIVVLSGYLQKNDWHGPPILGFDTFHRMVYAAELARHWPDVPIIVSGGKTLGNQHPAVSQAMKKYLLRYGIAASRITEESNSQSTFENAVETAGLLSAQNINSIALVTHAGHMRRAQAAFKKQGLSVIPAPCCFDSSIDHPDITFFLPSWWSLSTMQSVVYEIMAMIVYKYKGRI